jgi:MFS transporter, DHA2 family, multidrug resistance protein
MNAPARAAPQPLQGAALITAAILLALANFMVVLDTTIANVSVPHIAGALAVSPAQGTWVITSYAVAEAITVPLTGWLAGRFGAVRVFVFGMIGFGICSLACGFAPTFGSLVLFRVLQGLCGGPLMPMSQTLMMHIFPREKAPQALGIWSMTTVTAPIVGPILGGFLSDNVGWHWIFLINIPVAAVVAFLAFRALRDHDTPTIKVPVDYLGLGLLVLWVGSLQIMLDKGKELDWFSSPVIVGLGLVALVGFAAFLIWELTARNPIVNLRVFRHRGFVIGVITLSLTFGTFFASVVLLPLWLQTSMGYTASWAGYALCLNGVLAVIMSPIVAKLVPKVDVRILVSFAITYMAMIALWRTTFTTGANFWYIAMPQLVLGFAIPFFFIPTTSLALSSVLPEEVASASGLANFLRTCGAAFATSIATTMWDNTSQARHSELSGHLNGAPATLDALVARGFSYEQARGQLDGLVQTQAVMLSTNTMFLYFTGAFLLAACIVWFAPRPKLAGPPGGGGH